MLDRLPCAPGPWLGIDPGLDGAWSLWDGAAGLTIWDMPTTAPRGAPGRRVCPAGVLAIARAVARHAPKAAVLEAVGGMSGQDASAAFNFGAGWGFVVAALHSVGLPPQLVHAVTWKARVGCTSNKDQARALASRLFPEFAGYFARVSDDGRAEASLLAVYGALPEKRPGRRRAFPVPLAP